MTESTLITDYLGKGLDAAKPVSLSMAAGVLAQYLATDTNVLYYWSGSAWVSLGALTPQIWNAGSVTALGTHLAINSGTLDVSAADKIRTLPLSLVGAPPGGQHFNVTLTQAGTLLANGGTPQSYIPTHPTATQTIALNTIHAGTITARGTISISTGGAVTFPTFSAVAIAAGDTVQFVNQGTADATFADACLSLQFQVT